MMFYPTDNFPVETVAKSFQPQREQVAKLIDLSWKEMLGLAIFHAANNYKLTK